MISMSNAFIGPSVPALKLGLFGEAVLNLISNSPSVKDRQKVIDKIKLFIEDINTGKGIINGNPVNNRLADSLKAYETSMNFLYVTSADSLDDLIEDLNKEVGYLESLGKGKVNEDRVKTLKSFFEMVLERALNKMGVPALS